MKPQVVIIDYKMGNLFSICRVINHLGGEAVISTDPLVITSAERLILPGVGAFGDGMSHLRELGLIEPIKKFARSDGKLLGICLGMQLLMSESEEFGSHLGLNLVDGKVKRFLEPTQDSENYKIPHVGWNGLDFPKPIIGREKVVWQGSILEDVAVGAFVYFVHSYIVSPVSPAVVLAETVYGRDRFCSVLRMGNMYGCQFHPEVSGNIGLNIVKSFISN